MGCFASKPAAVEQQHTAPQRPYQQQDTFTQQELPDRLQPLPEGKLLEVGAGATDDTQPSTSSPDTTPTDLPVLPKRRSTSERAMRARNAEGLQRRASEPLPEALQDYSGAKLERKDNDRLEHITRLLCTILKVPCALIVLAREASKMTIVSAHGVEPEDDAWLQPVCAWALGQPNGMMTVEDLAKDLSTSKKAWVREDPTIRFYAGSSLHSGQGDRLGILCALDFEPHPGAGSSTIMMENMSEMVTRELELHPHVEEDDEQVLFRAMDTYWDGSVLVDTTKPGWVVKYCNKAFSELTGIPRDSLLGKPLWDFVELMGSQTPATKPWQRFANKAAAQDMFDVLPVAVSTSTRGSDSTASTSSRSSKQLRFKINMRPNTEQIMQSYSVAPDAERINGFYFAVFTTLATNSKGTYEASRGGALENSAVPFEDVEMGQILGKGSFGCVYSAAWRNQVVAVKVMEYAESLRKDETSDILEASLMLKLRHPNIVDTLKYTTRTRPNDESPESPEASTNGSNTTLGSSRAYKPSIMESWLMLEYCDMGCLSDGILNGFFHQQISGVQVPKMTVILETARDIASGLAYIHSENILHGDLTTGNILLHSCEPTRKGGKNFIAKVADFGLSRKAITTKVETNTYGTVTHMPPELLNDGHLSKAADTYGYGVLLYEIYTTQPVWEGMRHPQIIHAIAVQKRHPELPDTAPQGFRSLAHRCMASEPSVRPTMEEIIHELDALLKVNI